MQSTDVNVWEHAYLVFGTRGRCPLVMVVPACVLYGQPHQHGAKRHVSAMKRTASCHGGRYAVHLGTIQEQVAA
jgi:hypothetical protein